MSNFVFHPGMDAAALRDCIIIPGLRTQEQAEKMSKHEMVDDLTRLRDDLLDVPQKAGGSACFKCPATVNLNGLSLPASAKILELRTLDGDASSTSAAKKAKGGGGGSKRNGAPGKSDGSVPSSLENAVTKRNGADSKRREGDEASDNSHGLNASTSASLSSALQLNLDGQNVRSLALCTDDILQTVMAQNDKFKNDITLRAAGMSPGDKKKLLSEVKKSYCAWLEQYIKTSFVRHGGSYDKFAPLPLSEDASKLTYDIESLKKISAVLRRCIGLTVSLPSLKIRKKDSADMSLLTPGKQSKLTSLVYQLFVCYSNYFWFATEITAQSTEADRQTQYDECREQIEEGGFNQNSQKMLYRSLNSYATVKSKQSCKKVTKKRKAEGHPAGASSSSAKKPAKPAAAPSVAKRPQKKKATSDSDEDDEGSDGSLDEQSSDCSSSSSDDDEESDDEM